MPAIAPAASLYGNQAISERSLDLRTDLTTGVLFSSRVLWIVGTNCEVNVKMS
jgi:hypothetical protein